MNKDDLLKKLENLNLPEIELSGHQRQLRMALLNSGYWKEKNTMSIFKKFMPVSAVALVAIIAVGVLSMGSAAPQVVSAQEIAHKSFQEVSNMTPAKRAEFAKTVQISGDPSALLAQAESAKDLTVITYEQFVSQSPNGVLPPAPKGNSVDLHTLKFLQFTAANGSKVTLGIDPKTNLPVFVNASFRNDKPDLSGGEEYGTSAMLGNDKNGNATYGTSQQGTYTGGAKPTNGSIPDTYSQ